MGTTKSMVFKISHIGCFLYVLYTTTSISYSISQTIQHNSFYTIGEMSEVKSTDITYFKEWLKKLNEDIIRFTQTLPAYKFLTAVSQLVSRICHPSKQVWELLKGKDLLNYNILIMSLNTFKNVC